jgi:hypothetical protein
VPLDLVATRATRMAQEQQPEQPAADSKAPAAPTDDESAAGVNAIASEMLGTPKSNRALDEATLKAQYEAQVAAAKQAAPGSKEQAAAMEAAAQAASDLAWKAFGRSDSDGFASWFALRRDKRAQAYRIRLALLNKEIADADAAHDKARAPLEPAYADLQKRFPTRHARLLGEIRKADLPARPIGFASSMEVQKILLALQEESRAAYQAAKDAGNAALAKAHFEESMALSRIFTPLAESQSSLGLRWLLATQRNALTLSFKQEADRFLYAQQDLAARRKDLARALAAGEKGAVLDGFKAEAAKMIEWVADFQGAKGQAEAAQRGYDESAALRRTISADNEAASLRSPLDAAARMYFKMGQIRRARGLFERALAEHERTRAAREAKAVGIDPTMRPFLALSDAATEATLLNNLAVATSATGDIKGALAYLERADASLKAVPSTPLTDTMRRAFLLTTRGNRVVTLVDSGEDDGDATKFAPEFEAIARERRELGQDEEAANAFFNAAGIYDKAGQKEKARQYLLQARALSAAAEDTRSLLLTSNWLSDQERIAGRLDEAEKLNQEAARLADSVGDLTLLAAVGRKKALLLLARKRPAEALQALGGVRALDAQIGWPIGAARTLEIEGDALASQIPAGAAPQNATREAAIAKYKAAIALLEGVREKAVSEKFSDQSDVYSAYGSLVSLLIQAGRGEEAFDYLSRARSKKLRDSLRLDALKTRDPALQVLLDRAGAAESKLRGAQDALRNARALPPTERDPQQINELQRVVASTQGEFLRVARELRDKNPNYDKVISVKPTELKAAQRAIPADVALVQYAPLGEQLYIFVVTRESLKIFAPPVKPSDLSTRIREFRRLMDQAREKFENGEEIGVVDWATDNAAAPLRDNLLALHQMLLAPIEAEIAPKSTIAFIPTQHLYYLPLHALAKQTPGGVKFFIEEKRVVYLASADVLKVVQPRDEGDRGKGLVALGNPKGADLPFAGEEARDVARVFEAASQKAQFVTGADATKAALLDPDNLDKRVWHLATHGYLNQADPMRSYIQLAQSADSTQSRLTLDEVWGLDMKRVDLVTLSACQTALGERDPDGSEITSLADSFGSAGAQSVLASLWSVADDSTSTLMTEFYGSLSKGKSKAHALQDAELALLKKPETNHPFFWAPFVLMGDWR